MANRLPFSKGLAGTSAKAQEFPGATHKKNQSASGLLVSTANDNASVKIEPTTHDTRIDNHGNGAVLRGEHAFGRRQIP